jgi:hypothetical protein
VKELETKLEEVSKDRDDWAKKYQELSKKNGVTYDFDNTRGLSNHFTHLAYGYKLVAHDDGSISITPAEEKK